MTVWRPDGIAAIWHRAGGSDAATQWAVAVALAESGGDDHAISPSWDYGLFQINVANWQAQGLNGDNWKDPLVNARVAVRMSGNGTNWAPWCTCWVRLQDCGHGFLPVPQAGSNAERIYRGLEPNLAGLNHQGGPTSGSGGHAAASAWSGFQQLINVYGRQRYGTLNSTAATLRGMRK